MKNVFLPILLLILSFSIAQIKADIISSNGMMNEVLNAVDQRDSSNKVFERALSSNNQKIQKEALIGLGRIGDKTAILQISSFLYSPQPNIRAMAAFALGITDEPAVDSVIIDTINVHKLLSLRLKTEQHPVVITRLLLAMGNIGDSKSSIADILPFLDHNDPEVVASACDGLTLAWTFHRDRVSVPNSTQVYKLFKLSLKDQLIAEHCLYTLSRLRREPALFDQSQFKEITQKLTSTTAKILMLRIMGAMNNQTYLDYFISLTKKSIPEAIRLEAATAIASLDFTEENFSILSTLMKDENNHIKVNMINRLTLSKQTTSLNKLIISALDDSSQWVRDQALLALFKIQPTEMNSLFLKQLKSDTFSDQQSALNILRQNEMEKKQTYLEILTNSTHTGIKEIASRLVSNENADEDDLSPANKSIQADEALEIAGKQLTIMTNKGNIKIQLFTSTPFTSANFYQLATTGFYDNLIFHRVIGNFVAQAGDPKSTGEGGPGYRIREELYPIEHNKGTLGMATSGKDTGGSQFFFNTGNNIHLNNNYTVFARVTQGLDIIEQLEVGDKILSIKK